MLDILWCCTVHEDQYGDLWLTYLETRYALVDIFDRCYIFEYEVSKKQKSNEAYRIVRQKIKEYADAAENS